MLIATFVLVAIFAENALTNFWMLQTKSYIEAVGENRVAEWILDQSEGSYEPWQPEWGQFRIASLDDPDQAEHCAIPPQDASRYGLESIRGFNPMVSRELYQWVAGGVGEKKLNFRPVTDLKRFEIKNRKPLDVLNVRYITSQVPLEVEGLILRKTFENHKVYLVNRKTEGMTEYDRVYVYENVIYMPRAYAAFGFQFQLFKGKSREEKLNDVLDSLASLDLNSFAIVESDLKMTPEFQSIVNADKPAIKPIEPLEIQHLAGEILIDSHGFDQAAMIVVSELFRPGWKATVNGKPSTIHRVNGICMGVYLEPTKNNQIDSSSDKRPIQIRFYYMPNSYRITWWISLVTMIFTLVGLFVCLNRKRSG